MSRWSKLQKQIYCVIDPTLDLQVQCRVYRMNSVYGHTGLPRYWITLRDEVIWDYPKQFIRLSHPKREKPRHYPYATDISDISNLIREYIDTPRELLLSTQFENDRWGLINILRAADRRIGKRQWRTLRRKTDNTAALKVLDKRT